MDRLSSLQRSFWFTIRSPIPRHVKIPFFITFILLASPLFIGQSLLANSGRPVSTVQSSGSSWNPNVNCAPTLLTMEQYIGTVANPAQKSPSQGADYSGGALPLEGRMVAGTDPASASWPYSKRSTSPPCTVTLSDGTVLPTFVQIDNVQVGYVSNDECGAVFANTCDETFNTCNIAFAPNCNSSYPDTMHRVHNEIDMYWQHNGIAPPAPTTGSMVDVQGFVFWDDQHLADSWHSFSGWEVHPLTAWRPSTGSGGGGGSSDFTIGASPTSLTIQLGTSATSTISLSSTNGFTGTVSLSSRVSPSGPSASFNPSTITLSSGSTATSTLTVNVLKTTATGTYSITVTGSSGSLAHSTTVSVTVTSQPPPPPPPSTADFSITSNPASLTMPQGGSGSSKLTLTSLNGFTGTVSLTTLVSPSGLTASVNPTSVTLSSGGSSLSTLGVQSSSVGQYTVNVTGTSGSLKHTVSIHIHVKHTPGIQAAVSPSPLTAVTGTTTSSTVSLTSLDGFTGQVALSTKTPTGGIDTHLQNDHLNLNANQTSQTLMQLSPHPDTPPGNYSLEITATSGSIIQTITVPMIVSSFTMTTDPGSVSFQAGHSSSFKILVNSVNQFNNNVKLTVQSDNNHVTASLASPTIQVASGTTGSSIVQLASTTNGDYNIHVTASYGTLVRTLEIKVSVTNHPDFIMSTDPSFLQVKQGSSQQFTVTVTGLNNIGGTVNLHATTSPGGPLVSSSSDKIPMTAKETGSSVITIFVPASVHPGLYSVVISGADGPTHQVTLSLYVT